MKTFAKRTSLFLLGFLLILGFSGCNNALSNSGIVSVTIPGELAYAKTARDNGVQGNAPELDVTLRVFGDSFDQTYSKTCKFEESGKSEVIEISDIPLKKTLQVEAKVTNGSFSFYGLSEPFVSEKYTPVEIELEVVEEKNPENEEEYSQVNITPSQNVFDVIERLGYYTFNYEEKITPSFFKDWSITALNKDNELEMLDVSSLYFDNASTEYVGKFNFKVKTTYSESAVYEIPAKVIVEAKPVNKVTVTGPATAEPNKDFTLTASVEDTAIKYNTGLNRPVEFYNEYKYQWYEKTATGGWIAIDGATESDYKVAKGEGSYDYKCAVTSMPNGVYAEYYADVTTNNVVESMAYSVVVTSATVNGIVINTQADAKAYVYSLENPPEFSSEGLSLNVNYSDGTSKTVYSGFTCSGYDLSKIGKQTVKVSYGGLETSYEIQVRYKLEPTFNVIDNFEIKVNYEEGKSIKESYTVPLTESPVYQTVDGGEITYSYMFMWYEGDDKGQSKQYLTSGGVTQTGIFEPVMAIGKHYYYCEVIVSGTDTDFIEGAVSATKVFGPVIIDIGLGEVKAEITPAKKVYNAGDEIKLTVIPNPETVKVIYNTQVVTGNVVYTYAWTKAGSSNIYGDNLSELILSADENTAGTYTCTIIPTGVSVYSGSAIVDIESTAFAEASSVVEVNAATVNNAQSYYVDTTLSVNGTGTQSSPFNNLADAFDADYPAGEEYLDIVLLENAAITEHLEVTKNVLLHLNNKVLTWQVDDSTATSETSDCAIRLLNSSVFAIEGGVIEGSETAHKAPFIFGGVVTAGETVVAIKDTEIKNIKTDASTGSFISLSSRNNSNVVIESCYFDNVELANSGARLIKGESSTLTINWVNNGAMLKTGGYVFDVTKNITLNCTGGFICLNDKYGFIDNQGIVNLNDIVVVRSENNTATINSIIYNDSNGSLSLNAFSEATNKVNVFDYNRFGMVEKNYEPGIYSLENTSNTDSYETVIGAGTVNLDTKKYELYFDTGINEYNNSNYSLYLKNGCAGLTLYGNTRVADVTYLPSTISAKSVLSNLIYDKNIAASIVYYVNGELTGFATISGGAPTMSDYNMYVDILYGSADVYLLKAEQSGTDDMILNVVKY